MTVLDKSELQAFFVRVKANAQVGGEQNSLAYRLLSLDLLFQEGSSSNFYVCFPGQNGRAMPSASPGRRSVKRSGREAKLDPAAERTGD